MRIKILFLLLGLCSMYQSLTAQNIRSNQFIAKLEAVEWDNTVDQNCGKVIVEIRYHDSQKLASGSKIEILHSPKAIYITPSNGKVEILTDQKSLNLAITAPNNSEGNQYIAGKILNLQIKAGQNYTLSVELLRKESIAPPPPPPPLPPPPPPNEPEVFKPVLYFYPKKEMSLKISLKPHGEFSFTYPKYEDGWSAKISPNGNIQIDGRNYPYLFWEGKLKGIAPEVRQTGFVVEAEETIPFLEEKLALMGLNEREMTDFITFWAPRLELNPYNFIHFVRGNEYESQIAQMQLSQQPDSKIRIHLWYAPLNAPIQVKEQELDPKKRKGFTVVEWGGGVFDWMAP